MNRSNKLRTPAVTPARLDDNTTWGGTSLQQRAIARHAAQMCAHDEVIAINGGDSTSAMAEFLTMPLTILTNSFRLAHRLLLLTDSDVELAAGTIYRQQDLIHSPFDSNTPETRYVSKFFTGAHSVSPHGLSEADPLRIQAAQQFLAISHEIIVLADSGKLAARADLIMCRLDRVSRLVTDTNATDAAVQMLERSGVKVVTVPPLERGIAYH